MTKHLPTPEIPTDDQTSTHSRDTHRQPNTFPQMTKAIPSWKGDLGDQWVYWIYLNSMGAGWLSGTKITPMCCITEYSHPIMDELVEDALWSSLSFPIHSSPSQDHLYLGHGEGSDGWTPKHGSFSSLPLLEGISSYHVMELATQVLFCLVGCNGYWTKVICIPKWSLNDHVKKKKPYSSREG